MRKYLIIIIITILSLLKLNAQDLKVSLNKTDKECNLGKASITIVSGIGPYQYLWSEGTTENSVSNLETGDYHVKITDSQLQDTTVNFTIEESICAPSPENNFTPNYDGYNDTWNISRLQYFPEFELVVYNRWGQQVHHQINSYIPWDGTQLGLPLPDATYYYILFFNKTDKNKFIKGDVSIIR